MANRIAHDPQRKQSDALARALNAVRRRLFVRRWLRFTAVGLAMSAGAGCLWVVLTRLFPVLGQPALVVIALLVLGYLGAAVAAFIRRPTLLDAALAADAALGLKERLTSSLELAGRSGPMVDAVHADARRKLDGLKLGARFPLSTDSRKRWVYAPLVALGLAYTLFPSFDLFHYTERQAEARARDAAVAVHVERIQSDLEPLKANAELAEAGLSDLTADIEAMTADLKQGALTERQAMAKLSDLAEALQQQREALAKQGQMPQLGAELNPSGMSRELARALQNGQLGKAAEKARELADKLRNGDLSQREREQVQRELKSLANALKGQGSELSQSLAQALSKAAASLESGDVQGALEAMKAAELSLEDMASVLGQLEKMDTMMAYLSEWQGEMMGPSGYCRTCGMKMSECEGGQCCTGGNANCSGCGNGTCNGNGQGLGLRGAGHGRGNRLGDIPEVEAGFQPTMAKGPLTKGKMLADLLQRTAPEEGEEAQVEYVSGAFVELKQEAEQALTQEEIPPGSKEFVRQYFGSLEPEE